MLLLTEHGTFFAEMVRQAIRHSILEGLQERVANDDRKDLRGVHPYVDREATVALLNSKWARRFGDDVPGSSTGSQGGGAAEGCSG